MTDIHGTTDLVIKALRRAWQLGQKYWQQADSEYRSDWEKADATLDAFDQLVADTKAALTSNSGAQPASSVPELLESLRCACNYIDKLGGVSQQYRAVLAASPKPEGE